MPLTTILACTATTSLACGTLHLRSPNVFGELATGDIVHRAIFSFKAVWHVTPNCFFGPSFAFSPAFGGREHRLPSRLIRISHMGCVAPSTLLMDHIKVF